MNDINIVNSKRITKSRGLSLIAAGFCELWFLETHQGKTLIDSQFSEAIKNAIDHGANTTFCYVKLRNEFIIPTYSIIISGSHVRNADKVLIAKVIRRIERHDDDVVFKSFS